MSGRKTKLTSALIKETEMLLKAGNYDITVYQYLGISHETWYRWLKDGEKARSGLKREFYETVKRAQGYAEVRAVAGILKAGEENWTAFGWFLERKFPEKWGKKDRGQLEIQHKGEIKTDSGLEYLASLSVKELKEIVKNDREEEESS